MSNKYHFQQGEPVSQFHPKTRNSESSKPPIYLLPVLMAQSAKGRARTDKKKVGEIAAFGREGRLSFQSSTHPIPKEGEDLSTSF
jgi:hypothetical protein